jgi:hypothetical protein
MASGRLGGSKKKKTAVAKAAAEADADADAVAASERGGGSKKRKQRRGASAAESPSSKQKVEDATEPAAGTAELTTSAAARAFGLKVSVLLFTVTFNANHAHNLTRSP